MKFPIVVILSLIAPALSAGLKDHCKEGVKMITLDFTINEGDAIKECDATGSCLLTEKEVDGCKTAIGADKNPMILYGTKATLSDGVVEKKVAALGKHLLTEPSANPNKTITYDGLNIDISDLNAAQLTNLLSDRTVELIVLTMDVGKWNDLAVTINTNTDQIQHAFLKAAAAADLTQAKLGSKPGVKTSIIFENKLQAGANKEYHAIADKSWFDGHASVTEINPGEAFAEAFDSCPNQGSP